MDASNITTGTAVSVRPSYHQPLTGKGGCRSVQGEPVTGTVSRWLVPGEVALVEFDTYRVPDCECGNPSTDRAAFPVRELSPA